MTNYNTTTLSNGLRVIHLPSTSPVVYCGIGINAGARQEAEGEEGVAHFCEPILSLCVFPPARNPPGNCL